MSKKAKYKAVKDAMNPGTWFVESPRDIICQRCSMSAARKIARALNAMEDKPKAKPFAFDWSAVPERFKWAALDPDWKWWIYTHKPKVATDGTCFVSWRGTEEEFSHPPYTGDWRDSLQERP